MRQQLVIEKKWKPTDQEWDDAWEKCPYSTYFHSRDWAEIWEKYSQGKISPDPCVLMFSDGLKVLLPLSKEKIFRIFYNRHLSSPAGTYGGWLAPIALDKQHQTIISSFIENNYSDFFIRQNPYEKWLFPEKNKVITTYDETLTLDLSPSFGELFHSWTKGHVSAVKKAQRIGIDIVVAESPSDWMDYYRAYQDSLVRWGKETSSSYSWSLFSIMMDRKVKNIKLWLARYQGIVIAGALCFYSPHHVVYWHGAAISEFFHLRPVNLLLFEAISDAKRKGYSWFDFNPSGGHQGVRNFKKSFGTIGLDSSVIVRMSPKKDFLYKLVRFVRKI